MVPENSFTHILLQTSTEDESKANAKFVVTTNANKVQNIQVEYTQKVSKGTRVVALNPWGQNNIVKLNDLFTWRNNKLELK